MPNDVIRCKVCGAINRPEARYCHECGDRLSVGAKKKSSRLPKMIFTSLLVVLISGLGVIAGLVIARIVFPPPEPLSATPVATNPLQADETALSTPTLPATEPVPPTEIAVQNGRILLQMPMVNDTEDYWLIDPDGGNSVYIGTFAESLLPTISPNGQYMVLLLPKDKSQDSYQIKLIHLEQPIQQHDLGEASLDFGPVWDSKSQLVPTSWINPVVFSLDSLKLMFVDVAHSSPVLTVIDLPTMMRNEFTYWTASNRTLAYANFMADSNHVLAITFEAYTAESGWKVVSTIQDFEITKYSTTPKVIASFENQILIGCAVSSDREQIAFSFVDAENISHLITIDLDNLNQNLIQQSVNSTILPTQWSGNNDWLFYSVCALDAECNLYSYNTSTQRTYEILSYSTDVFDDPYLIAKDDHGVSIGSWYVFLYPFSRPFYITSLPDNRILIFSFLGNKKTKYWIAESDGIYVQEIIESNSYWDHDAEQKQEIVLDFVNRSSSYLFLIFDPGDSADESSLYSNNWFTKQSLLLDTSVNYNPSNYRRTPKIVVSPNQQRIAYLRITDDGGAELCTIGIDGLDKQMIAAYSNRSEIESGETPFGLPIAWLPAP